MALKELAISIGIGAALSTSFSKNIKSAGTLMDQLKNKTSDLKKTQRDLKKYENMQLIRKETRSEIIYSQKELVKLKNRLLEVDKEGRTLGSTYKLLEKEINQLSSKEKLLKDRMAMVAIEMKEGKGDNKKLQEEYRKLQKETKGITNELTPLKKRLNEVGKELSSNSKESTNLGKQQLNLENKIQSLREKQKKNINEIRETTKQLKEQSISIKDTAKSYEELEKKANAYNKALEHYQKANAIKEKGSKIASYGNLPLKAAGVATVAGAGALSEAIRAETAFAGVKKQFDFETAEEEAKFKEDLLKLVAEKRIAVSLEELYGMAANAGQSGLNKDEAVGYIEAAANMGMAFNMSREQASEYMFAWRNTFEMNLTQLKELTDQINTLGNNTGASEIKIAEFITRMGNLPTVVGMATNQTAALGASLMEMGMAPEIAATGAKRLLTILNKGMAATGSEKEALNILGLDPDYLAKATLEDPEKALETVFFKLSKLKEHEQGAVMTMLFGEEGKVAAANIMGAFDRLKRNINLAKDSNIYSGATNKEAEIQKNTAANQLQVLKTEFDVIKADLGTELLPLVKEGATYLKAFLEKLLKIMKEDPEGFKRMVKLFVYGTGALYGFGGALKLIGGLLHGYAGIVNLVGLATEKELGLKTIRAAKTITQQFKNLGKAGLQVGKIIGNGILNGGKLASNGVVKFTKMSIQYLKLLGSTGLQVGKTIGLGILNGGKFLIGGLAKLGSLGMAALASPITWVILGITALIAAGYMLYKNWDTVKEKAVQLKDKVVELVDKYWYLLGPIGYMIKGGKALYENWDTIKLKAGKLKDKIVNMVTGAIEQWNIFKEKSLAILGIPFDWLDKKIEGIKEKGGHMLDGVLEIYEKIKNFSITDSIKNGASWLGEQFNIPQFATGGVVNSPTLALIGEGGSSESIIPHERTPKSLNLWEKTGKLLGAYKPTSTTNNNSSATITFSYSPTIYANDSNSLETTLKKDKGDFERWFKESMNKYEKERFRRGYGR
ncbi:phage tail tape measure protein [Fusobacterium mortiferum]|uniref:Phage tail tape measure protein n=1 Tax=Fusobacterium mortiferum ATCC 9817 TaxID=469616 RepID=A0ABM6TWD1_FUSMR|nr:phage tail tape measure protein [Fusobacterium mortiferum]AVQ18908.1 phage tail tape measure protein [Fusobacterium mortiferum ATCC 9817]EEO35154.2 phage tail tape measure protein, TP901 family [Fusobacterium mortiferum ATCC 9817]